MDLTHRNDARTQDHDTERALTFICALFCTWALWIVGFAPMPTQHVTLGGDVTTHRRGLDEPFLEGFWGPEPAQWEVGQSPYRWSKPEWAIHWPGAGTGLFVTSISVDASAYPGPRGATLTWQSPALGTTPTHPGTRTLTTLVRGDGLHAGISIRMPALEFPNERRELGIVVRTISLNPTTRSWRPVQVVVVLLSIILAWSAMRHWQIRRPALWSAVFALGAAYAWHADPLWWMVHSTPTLWGIAISAAAAAIITLLVLPRTTDHIGWWWVLTGVLVVPIMPLLSPYLHTSDSAMHVRMLFDVMRGTMYQVAELPCEASAWTVPYPPLTYLLTAPFAITTWDRATATQILMVGSHILHVAALVYIIRILSPSTTCTPNHICFLFVAAWSLPFLQSVHIGELSNAWGHALYIVSLTGLFDPKLPRVLRGLFVLAALCVHTGIALSFGLTFVLLTIIEAWHHRSIPWRMVGLGMVVAGCAILLYYSTYVSLIGQPLKYPGCPPHAPIENRLAQIPLVLPMLFVLLSALGTLHLRTRGMKTLVWAAVATALASIAVLLVRDQTIRWGMAFYPFGALAVSAVLFQLRRYGRAGVFFSIGLVGTIVFSTVVQFWERIYTYLH